MEQMVADVINTITLCSAPLFLCRGFLSECTHAVYATLKVQQREGNQTMSIQSQME